MRFSRLAVLLSSALLVGCSTFDEKELAAIERRGVSPRLMDKMEHGHVLTPEDVIELTRQKVPDQYILRQIDDTGVDYLPTTEDERRLKKAGVSPAVIDALFMAGREFARLQMAPRYDPYLYDPYYYDDFY